VVDKPNLISRGLITFLSKLQGLSKVLSKLQVRLYRLSGGRIANTFQGYPICLVTMTGRKSGRQLTLPLMFVPRGDDILLVASFGGSSTHPAWYHNLVASPKVIIEVGHKRLKMSVREADEAEKALLWPLCVANYPEYSVYQNRTDRDIPVMVCEKEQAET
jgi:deazaflavin-dependent oxidoreductase (nitroreductase family)